MMIILIIFSVLLDIGINIQLSLAFVCISFQLINVYTLYRIGIMAEIIKYVGKICYQFYIYILLF